MKKRYVFLIGVGIILILIFGSTLISKNRPLSECESLECFDQKFVSCSRAEYIHNGDFTYRYKILGEKNEKCNVETELLFARAEPKFDVLIGKKMLCKIPLRKIDLPSEDLEYCSGPLKEELQLLLIKELYEDISRRENQK